MRKLIATLSVIALIAAVGAVTALGATSVSWKDPSVKTVKISKGGKVKWVWADKLPHNVHGPGLKTKIVTAKGHSVSKVFKSKGTFTYKCDVHPTSMKTKVKVG
jgi:plastocyanin